MNGNLKRVAPLATALLGYLMLAQSVQAASFDCGKASTKVEHLICDNPEISKLDDELAKRYDRELQYWLIADETKKAQKQWMEERNACPDKVCVKQAYQTRLRVLEANQSEPTPEAGRLGKQARYVIYGPGHGQGFCKAILAALNKKKPTNDYRPCISEEILKLPGVSDPPWEKLDLSQHEELAKKLLILSSVGEDEYFREKKHRPLEYPTLEQQQRGLGRAKELGAELFTMRMPPEWHEDNILITLKQKSDMCGRPIGNLIRGEAYSAAWVTADLKEIAKLGGALSSRTDRALLYKGRLYMVQPHGSEDGLEIHAANGLACDIRFFSR